ncbi:MAG: ABC transporter permease [Elusimicrobia bacterium]|nr:ABC transporter permease [Elusimicrobiota bacterium]
MTGKQGSDAGVRLGLALRTGLREIGSNRTRSILSFSAVSVGIASLLYSFAQVRGMSLELRRAFDLMGPGRMTIRTKSDYQPQGVSQSPGLTSDDAGEIARLPGLFMAYPRASAWGMEVHYQGKRFENVRVIATTEAWAKRDWVFTRRGRFLNSTDVRTAARVCAVIEPGGWEKKPFWAVFFGPEGPFESLLHRHDMLGRSLMIGGHLFTVVGVLRDPPRDNDPRWNREWGGDGIVLVPITAYQQNLERSYSERSPHSVDSIVVDTGDESTLAATRRAIEAILKRRHRGEVDYEVIDNREEIQGEMTETRQYIFVGMALGSVAILAGGIGIMNVTLATIFQRIKEIGIRRALGASRGDIVAQFVAEATLLGLLGGAAGIGLGLAGIEYIARRADRDVASFAWYHFVGALALAAATGFIFSVGPAWRASGLDPVEALRNE